MNIAFSSHAFAPSVGGIESCSLDLALEFSKLGHEVRVVTQTTSDNATDDHGLNVLRRPCRAELLRVVKWSHVLFQNNISLQTAWPALLLHRPWVVCSATWLRKSDGTVGLSGRLKRLALAFATNIYISHAMARHIGYEGVHIPNPYNAETFRLIPDVPRGRSLVFAGRLVSDKGCDILLESLAELRTLGSNLSLTIIGSGPEEVHLRQRASTLNLESQVYFAGPLRGEALARELNRHEIMVVPSRWEEPFGIVALEGIACGCLVVGSKGGGLADAIGDCGLVFPNGDVRALTQCVRTLLSDAEVRRKCRLAAPAHLSRHHIQTVAARYLEVFAEVSGRN